MISTDYIGDLINRLAHFQAERFSLVAAGNNATVVVAENNDGAAVERGVEHPLARHVKVIRIANADHNLVNRLIEASTLPHTVSSSPGSNSMGSKDSFDGIRNTLPSLCSMRLRVNSPLIKHTQISPSAGLGVLCITSRSPSLIPSPFMLSPSTQA